MKKFWFCIFLLFLCLLNIGGVQAQVNYISPSQLEPHWGFIRKAPCGNGAGDNCGSNPPTWHITPDQCGTLISTSGAKNADGSESTNGDRYTLPLLSELIAYGYGTANGNAGNLGSANRAADCELSFVMALPYPQHFLRIGMDGAAGSDKVTFIAGGAFHDLSSGDVIYPAMPGVITVRFDGVSWLETNATPALAELTGFGQMNSSGNGKLFYVTANPAWLTVSSRIGSLAYCPNNGKGVVTDNNGGVSLALLPSNCIFHDPGAGTLSEWIVARWFGSFGVNGGIAAGTAYVGGVAPDGVAYGPGNYVVLNDASTVAFADGNTVDVHNMPTALGTVVNGRWIGKLLTAPATGCTVGTCIELHEAVHDFYGHTSSNPSMIGPPSSFVGGDSVTTVGNIVAGSYFALTTSSFAVDRATDPVSGSEIEGPLYRHAIVGFARHVANLYSDTTTNRLVASYYNPVEKKCQTVTGADRTTASLVFVAVNADMTCPFVFLNHSSKQARSLGDVGRGVRYSLTLTVANNTANDGCEIAVGFDGVTAEPEIARVMNGAAVQGAVSITISGLKTGLTEANHDIRPLIRAVTGGTCTVTAVSSNLTAFIWQ